jgi:hypothetical protein
MNYVSGVYHNLGANDPVVGGHMIAIVGYSDALGAWLLRNSWGTEWGMAGYCWIKYGDSDIDNTMYQIVPTTPTPPPPVTSVPISITAYDLRDIFYVRTWAVFVDKPPGAYLGNSKWAAGAPVFSILGRSGAKESGTLPITSGTHTVYFVISQSGGTRYRTYSGTVTIDETAYPYAGVTAKTPASFTVTI